MNQTRPNRSTNLLAGFVDSLLPKANFKKIDNSISPGHGVLTIDAKTTTQNIGDFLCQAA